ncbi:MAG: beta-ketoacyl synthase N-terminal-like domain-containing protein, partial [Desulfobacteraceae bacterium]
MNQVVVTHTGAVTAMGDDLETLWQGLVDKQTAITTATRFATDNYISSCAALINDLVPGSKTAMVFQLAEMLMEQLPPLPRETLVLTASTKGGIEALEAARRKTEISKEQLIISSLPDYITRRLGLVHQGINISAACTSSTIALAKAASFIASGRCSSVLVLAVDII